MSVKIMPMTLASAHRPGRECDFCGDQLTAIELRHDCPPRRLYVGLRALAVRRELERAGLAPEAPS